MVKQKTSESFDTVKTLAKLWNVSERTIRREIASGELRAFRVGAQLRISPEERMAYERRRQT